MCLSTEPHRVDEFFELEVIKLNLRIQSQIVFELLQQPRLNCLLLLISPKVNEGSQIIYFGKIYLNISIIYLVVELV
jgi:hypothetical protein